MLRVAASSECSTVMMCWCEDDDEEGDEGGSGLSIRNEMAKFRGQIGIWPAYLLLKVLLNLQRKAVCADFMPVVFIDFVVIADVLMQQRTSFDAGHDVG